MSKSKWILILIIILGTFLRFYKLGQIPPALDVDEAPIGVNAHFILNTGRDEYGAFFPLAFRMLDDYRPPLYTYLTVFPIRIFGLNEFSVRFVSAVSGSLMVLVFYFLNKLLKLKPLIAAFLLAISPWSIFFSRFASEANTSLFFILVGIFFFIKSLENKKILNILFSSLFFILSFYTYQAARLFVPSMIVLLFVIFWKTIKKNLCRFAVFLIFSFILISPLIIFFIKSPEQSLMRLRGINFLSQTTAQEKSSARILFHQQNREKFLGVIFDNRRIFYFKDWLNFYLSYFDPVFLFFGDHDPRHHVSDVGNFYLVEGVFLLFGFFFLIKKYFAKKKIFWFIFFWLILSPLGGSFVWGGPHSGRGIFMLPVLLIIISLGFEAFLKIIKRRNIFLYTLICFYFLNLLFYCHSYYSHLNLENAFEWNWHYKMATLESQKIADSYSKIIVSRSLDFAYSPFLFYLQYDPVIYLKEGGTVSGMFNEKKNRIGKYYFCPLNYLSEKNNKNILFIGVPQDFSVLEKEGIKAPLLKKIKDWQDKDLIWLVQGVEFKEKIKTNQDDVCQI